MEILLEKVDEYILIVDYNGKIIFANGKFLKKFGYKKNELCNININEVIANEYLEIDKISAYKNGVNKELEIITKNSEKIKLESNIFIDEFKSKRSLFIVSKDINESNLTKEHIELLLDNIYTGAFIKDASGKYLYFSKTLCEFFGKSREEIIGKCDEEIFPSNIVETFKETDKIVFSIGVFSDDKKHEKDSKLKVIFLLAIPDIEEKDDDILVKIYDEIIAISKDKQVVENIAKVKNYRELLLYFIKQDNVFN